MEIEGESSLGRDSLQAGKRERRKKIENIYYTVPRAKRGENERSSIQRSCSPTSLTFSPLRFLSFLPFPKFFRVKSFFSLFHRFRHAVEVTRVSSLGKKLTVAPFTQNCRHSNGEAIHRCAGGRCFPSYDSTRYQPPTYIYIHTRTFLLVTYTRVHPLVYLSPRLTIHPRQSRGRRQLVENWVTKRPSIFESRRNFRRILIPFHLSSPPRHTLSHTLASYMFSFLSFPADTERPCVTLLLYARRAPVTLMSAPVVSLMRAIVKARL